MMELGLVYNKILKPIVLLEETENPDTETISNFHGITYNFVGNNVNIVTEYKRSKYTDILRDRS